MVSKINRAALLERIQELEGLVTKPKKAKSSTSDWWCSPPEIAAPLEQFFGGPVDVDPCSNDRSVIKAYEAWTYGGLVRPWWRNEMPGTVYQNDPYSKAAAWTDKMLRELTNGRVLELVRLSMMSTSAEWWGQMCNHPFHNPRVLGLKRLKFIDPDAPRAGMKRMTCRFEPALTYFGPRVEEFTRTFAHLTRWATWGR